MPLSVRCKSKSRETQVPYWPASAPPCIPMDMLPGQQQSFGQPPMFGQPQMFGQPPMFGQQPQAQSALHQSPIIVQAPAAPAPIVIQSPPVFLPMQAQSGCNSCNQTSAEPNNRNQSQGTSMPVLPAQTQDNSDSVSENDDRTQGQAAPSRSNSPRYDAKQSDTESRQPIIINIHNSQDTASNNRSLFAPRVHDESSQDTRLLVGARSRAEQPDARSPVPVIKTPIPETTSGASLVESDSNATNTQDPAVVPLTNQPPAAAQDSTKDSASKVQTKSPRFVLVRRGRLMHLRAVRHETLEPLRTTEASVPTNKSNTMYHYVGWS